MQTSSVILFLTVSWMQLMIKATTVLVMKNNGVNTLRWKHSLIHMAWKPQHPAAFLYHRALNSSLTSLFAARETAAAAAVIVPQLPGCPLESAALAHVWEFTFSKSCRDQKLVYDRETVQGDFDLAPFIKIVPEKELLLCYCSRPENHRAKWWYSLYVETMLFTRWVIKWAFGAHLKR